MKTTDNIATIGGITHTKNDVLTGLVNHLPAIRHLWPDWEKSDHDKHVTQSVAEKMRNDPYPCPTDYQGYTIYPPESFSDSAKWEWLVELLSRAGQISPANVPHHLSLPASGTKGRSAADVPEVPKGQGLPAPDCSRILFKTEFIEDGSIVVHAERTLRFATRIAGRSEPFTDERENFAKEHMTELIECGMDGFRKALKERTHAGDGIYMDHKQADISANVRDDLTRNAGGRGAGEDAE